MKRKIARENLKEVLKKTGGHFFTVEFYKKDGTLRKMNARLGVKRYLKGGENKVEAPDRPYMTVYDVQNKGYRTVNLHTVTKVRANGNEFEVD